VERRSREDDAEAGEVGGGNTGLKAAFASVVGEENGDCDCEGDDCGGGDSRSRLDDTCARLLLRRHGKRRRPLSKSTREDDRRR